MELHLEKELAVGLNIFIPKETAPHERRIASSPEIIKKLTALGCQIFVESGAGMGAHFTDGALTDSGALILENSDKGYKDADIILAVQSPSESNIALMKKGALLVGLLNPYNRSNTLSALAKADIIGLAMECVPRISRAQSMDVLSSQSNLSGYKSVLDAAEHYAHAFPMMMTAAGTIPPAKVFVMGAGVAGLQAIATAKRLGGVVSATDVRPAAKEQVQSLGASFIAVQDEEFKQAETSGGYAKEMSDSYKEKQAALIAQHIAKQDIVITTALIPGRPAPVLISDEMVRSLKPGSVIVDLAVENGGNCSLSKPGQIVHLHNVTIVGHLNVPSRLAADASALYAKNLFNLLCLIIDKDKKSLEINWDDEIIKGVAVTRDGQIIHPLFADKDADLDSRKSKGKKKSNKNLEDPLTVASEVIDSDVVSDGGS